MTTKPKPADEGGGGDGSGDGGGGERGDGCGAGTPTVCNSDVASQAIKEEAEAQEAAVASSRTVTTEQSLSTKQEASGANINPQGAVNWTPAALVPAETMQFDLGRAPKKDKAQGQGVPNADIQPPTDQLEEFATLRTDNGDPTKAHGLVWPDSKEKTGAGSVPKRTLPQHLGRQLPASATGPTGTNAGAPTQPKEPVKTSASTTSAQPPSRGDAAASENVWLRAKEVLLKEHKDKTPARVFPDELQYEEHYAVARRSTYRTMPDGYQRGLSPLEEEALFLWRGRVIHLEGPPAFITETHSLKERALLRQIHQNHMGYKVYVATPPQLKWPAATAKFHFCSSLLDKNQAGARSDVIDLIDDVHLFTCSAESHLAVLRFMRPETRDKWVGRSFKFPFGSITLRATDTFEQDDKKAGLDAQAIAMLYPIHLLGRPEMPLMDVHAVAVELAGGLPILDIVPMEATGGRTLETHEWRIILHSLEAPPGIAKLRCLKITQGDVKYDLGVHQPRMAQRHPCSVCLGIGHYRNQCKHKGQKAKIAELRPAFERALTLPATSKYALEPTATSLEEHREQMTRVRASLAPDLAAKDAAAVAAAAAAVAKANEELAQQAAAARAEEAKVFAAAAAAVKAAEAEAAAKAKLLRKKQAKAKKAKSPVSRFSAALQKPAKPAPVKSKGKSNSEHVTPAPPPRRVHVDKVPEELRWVGRASQYEHTEGHVPGQKRKWDCDADQVCADYFIQRGLPDAETNSEPPVRSLKTDGLRIVVRGRPDPRHVATNRLEQAVVTSFFKKAPADMGTSDATEDAESRWWVGDLRHAHL